MAKHFGYGFIGLAILALVAGLTAGTANAQEGDSGKSYKIGVVDMQLLLAEYDKRKTKYDDLQAEVDKLQVDIDEMSKNIEAAKKKYEESRDSMTEDERFDMRTEIEADHARYQAELASRQRQIDTMEERVLKEVIKDVQAAIEKLAEAGNYHLVLNGRGSPRGSVLYHSPTIDITSKVLAELNKG